MTQEQLDSLNLEISTAVDQAGNIIGVIDPALIPFIVLGKAVAKSIPGVVDVIQKWIAGTPPTDAERADLLAKLAVLSNPDLP